MENNHPIFTTPLAHRGLHNELYDENSIAAFKNAVDHNYGIELDVHLLTDGELVVFHDNNLKRIVGVDKEVDSLSSSDLNDYLLPKTKTPLPLLKDVLELVDGKVPILIELKIENYFNKDFPRILLELLDTYEYKDTIALQSFNPFAVKWLRKNQTYPYPLGQLGSDILPGQSKFTHFMFRNLYILKISKPNFLNYEVNFINKKKIQKYRKKRPLITWTIDNPEKLEIARKQADNIIFESIEAHLEEEKTNETKL